MDANGTEWVYTEASAIYLTLVSKNSFYTMDFYKGTVHIVLTLTAEVHHLLRQTIPKQTQMSQEVLFFNPSDLS
jgi:hypothetical protein